MRTRSLRFRLTMWYAAVLAAGLGLFGSLVWLSLRHQLMSDLDRELEGRASRFESYFRAESAEPGNQLRDELEEFCQALPPASFLDVRGSNGFAFRYAPGPPVAPADLRTLQREFTIDGERFDLKLGAPL